MSCGCSRKDCNNCLISPCPGNYSQVGCSAPSVTIDQWAECFPIVTSAICGDPASSTYIEFEAIFKRALEQVDPCIYGSNYEQALFTYAMLLLTESPCGQQILGADPDKARAAYQQAFDRLAKGATMAPIIV